MSRHDVPASVLHELLDGVARDCTPARYATLARALPVLRGRREHGRRDVHLRVRRDGGRPTCAARALQHARTLGVAMQLTNILRDVGEDARNGRCYLPDEDLARVRPHARGSARAACDARRRALAGVDGASRSGARARSTRRPGPGSRCWPPTHALRRCLRRRLRRHPGAIEAIGYDTFARARSLGRTARAHAVLVERVAHADRAERRRAEARGASMHTRTRGSQVGISEPAVDEDASRETRIARLALVGHVVLLLVLGYRVRDLPRAAAAGLAARRRRTSASRRSCSCSAGRPPSCSARSPGCCTPRARLGWRTRSLIFVVGFVDLARVGAGGHDDRLSVRPLLVHDAAGLPDRRAGAVQHPDVVVLHAVRVAGDLRAAAARRRDDGRDASGGGRSSRRLVLTAWDVSMDPAMVRTTHWIWHLPPAEGASLVQRVPRHRLLLRHAADELARLAAHRDDRRARDARDRAAVHVGARACRRRGSRSCCTR